eukprot:g6325.t1
MATVRETRSQSGRASTRDEAHEENQRILRTKLCKSLTSWLIIFPGAVAIASAIWINLMSHEFNRPGKHIENAVGDLYHYQPINLRLNASENNRYSKKCWNLNGKEQCSISWGTIFFCKRPANYSSIPFNSPDMTASCFLTDGTVAPVFVYSEWTPTRLSDGRYEEEGFDLVPPINWLLLVTAIFSLCGSMSIIYTFCKSKKLRAKQDLHLIFFMAIADFGFAFKFILSASFIFAGKLEIINNGIYGVNKDLMKNKSVEPMCLVSGILGQFFGLSTICWNCTIATNLIFNMKYSVKYTLDKKKQCEIFSHILSWGFPLITCIIGLATENFAMTYDGTCWLWGNYVYMFYGPLFLFIAINIYAVYVGLHVITPNMYLISHRLSQMSFRRKTASELAKQQKKEKERKHSINSVSSRQEAKKFKSFSRILTYCLAFISTWIWGMVLRIGTGGWNDLGVFNDGAHMNSYEAERPPAWLIFASAFFLGAGGAINASIWLEPLTREARKGLAMRIRRASAYIGLSTRTKLQFKSEDKISAMVKNVELSNNVETNNKDKGSYVKNPMSN